MNRRSLYVILGLVVITSGALLLHLKAQTPTATTLPLAIPTAQDLLRDISALSTSTSSKNHLSQLVRNAQNYLGLGNNKVARVRTVDLIASIVSLSNLDSGNPHHLPALQANYVAPRVALYLYSIPLVPGPPPPLPTSSVDTTSEILKEIEELQTSAGSKNSLRSIITNAGLYLDRGDSRNGRSRLVSFIAEVVNLSNRASNDQHRIPLDPAQELIKAAINILTGTYTLQQPSMLQADPGVVVVDTPTEVTFTLRVSDINGIPTSITLLRLSPDGQRSVIASLYDNGLGGDAPAGDGIYSARLSMTEPEVGTFSFEASMVLQGEPQPVVSEPMQFAVLAPPTIPVVLPPDPGEAGKRTLEGIDSDGDSVRDDLQRAIAFSSPESERVRAALKDYVQIGQAFLLAADRDSARAIAAHRRDAQDCIFSFLGETSAAFDLVSEIRAILLNTNARTAAYLSADKHLGGTVVLLTDIDELASKCTFDPASLEN